MEKTKKSRGSESMGGKKSSKHKSKKKSGKKVREMTLRRAHSGELLAKHRHEAQIGQEPPIDEEHVVPEGGLDAHVAEHMPAEQEEPAPAGATPPPAAGAMPGM